VPEFERLGERSLVWMVELRFVEPNDSLSIVG